MNTLFVAVFAALAVAVSAGVVGHGTGVVVAGPSGVVTPHGAIGPAGHGLGLGLGLGYGGYGHGAVVAAPVVAAPALGVGYGYGGLGLGHGVVGYGHGVGLGHGIGLGHGVAVRGPATVPAVIAGPSGKIVADGLYGVPHYGHYGHW
ncbi:glycine-rich protein-like [Zophobas morio]|uniref:glycine-rich protein-like n=1 Tax=Zophobas morio TaxID=2755281 RepID=UPI00308370A9